MPDRNPYSLRHREAVVKDNEEQDSPIISHLTDNIRVQPPRQSRYRDTFNETILFQTHKRVKIEESDDDELERVRRDTAKSRQQRYEARYGSSKQEAQPSSRTRSKSESPKTYTLRPRKEEINYQVRIPLYEASPRKDQALRKAQSSSYQRRDFGAMFSKNFAPVYHLQDEDSDEEVPVQRDAMRLGLIGSGKTSQPMSDTMLLNRMAKNAKLSDVDPLLVDSKVDFKSVGGLDGHIKSLKEMVLLPLLYPEVFDRFQIQPPRGVLFYGVPGTGKTLLARALANACSLGDTKVSFFMRKGADVLSKWVGDSERQLKELFEQARVMAPSIIFFDEIDGLAPVRSSKQDQIHASIVTTLLALMDGLESRGRVVVIGATNRIDSIDSALRRPGRFDREFLFQAPDVEARLRILQIGTGSWDPPVDQLLLKKIAECTRGYVGSDLKALCTETALCALERRYPQIYSSEAKLAIDVKDVIVEERDFIASLGKMIPSTLRVKSAAAVPLSHELLPLLEEDVSRVLSLIQHVFPLQVSHQEADQLTMKGVHKMMQVYRPRILILPEDDLVNVGHELIASHVLTQLDSCPVHCLDLETVYSDLHSSPEVALSSFIKEACRNTPSIVYIPQIDVLWESISDVARCIIKQLLNSIPASEAVLVFATTSQMTDDIQSQFAEHHETESKIMMIKKQTQYSMHKYWKQVASTIMTPITGVEMLQNGRFVLHPNTFIKAHMLEQEQVAPLNSLPPVAPVEPKKLTPKELKQLHEYDEGVFRRLRMLLREFCTEVLRCKEYKSIVKHLNPMEDYGETVKMDAQDILEKVERHGYQTLKPFRKDIFQMIEGFRRLSFERDDMYRLTHINALNDLLHEWMRTFDPQFVAEANDSASREQRLKSEYAELNKEAMEQQADFYNSLRPQNRDREERRSGRLKGEVPLLAEGIQVNTRKMRIIDSTDDEITPKELEQLFDGDGSRESTLEPVQESEEIAQTPETVVLLEQQPEEAVVVHDQLEVQMEQVYDPVTLQIEHVRLHDINKIMSSLSDVDQVDVDFVETCRVSLYRTAYEWRMQVIGLCKNICTQLQQGQGIDSNAQDINLTAMLEAKCLQLKQQ